MIGCGGLGFCVFFFLLPTCFLHPPALPQLSLRSLPSLSPSPESGRVTSHSLLRFFFSIGRHFSSSLIAFPSTSLSLAQGCADLPSSSLPLISLSTSLFIHAMHLRWSAPRSVAFGSFVSFLSFLFFLFSHCEIAMNLLFLSLLLNKLC